MGNFKGALRVLLRVLYSYIIGFYNRVPFKGTIRFCSRGAPFKGYCKSSFQGTDLKRKPCTLLCPVLPELLQGLRCFRWIFHVFCKFSFAGFVRSCAASKV